MATVLSPPEQRIVLDNISWDTYEHILAAHRDSSAPRFTYDRGSLEIMSPSPEHEELKDLVVQLVVAIVEGMGFDMRSFGSTTFRRKRAARGFEPDGCFYIQSVERIGKRELDLATDPPPDLVIEIDITSPSIKKFPIFFAQLGVPEVWHYDGKGWSIFTLEATEYSRQKESRALPGVTGEAIDKFIGESQSARRPEWLRRVREWAHVIKFQN